jgi:hypothetical protein
MTGLPRGIAKSDLLFVKQSYGETSEFPSRALRQIELFKFCLRCSQ